MAKYSRIMGDKWGGGCGQEGVVFKERQINLDFVSADIHGSEIFKSLVSES